MEPRRVPRAVSDPKVRHVGFFAPGAPPERSYSDPPHLVSSSPPVSDISPSGNSLSPVMIPPPRHLSSDLSRGSPLPAAPLSRDSIPVGSYNPSEFSSPTASEFTEDAYSPKWPVRRSNSGKFASSLPSGGFDMSSVNVKRNNFPSSSLTTVSIVNMPPGITEKDVGAGVEVNKEPTKAGSKPLKEKTTKAERRAVQEAQRAAKAATKEKDVGAGVEVNKELTKAGSKPLKEKTTKAERRALQEAQRSAKAATKADDSKTPPAPSGVVASANTNAGKAGKAPPQRKDSSSVAASEKSGIDRPMDKDRKKDVPHPRMQFDDKNRVEKAKKRSVVKQTEARNRVELFRHLPQYEHGTRLSDLESKLFQLDAVHPAVYKVGLRYLAGDISGGNARCIAMLQAFRESIKDYSTPPEKVLIRDLTAKINSYVSFLIECRPLSISMGNAIRFLKTTIAKLPLSLSESEAKAILCSDIDRFINEKIVLADKVIVKHAVTKIRDGDVLLTYGSSSAVEMLFLHAHELGKKFRVVVVDSRPKLEGKLLLRRLVGKGISCTYTHINAVSYIMHEVTRVFLGASSVLSNGMVYSRVGTACVAMVAHQFRIPILICCEAYKFHERVQLDSICSNDLGDPDAIAKVSGRKEINCLDDCANSENLQLLNLMYDVTPSDYVSMIITDYGMIPPTSVPVIVREYRQEHLWAY